MSASLTRVLKRSLVAFAATGFLAATQLCAQQPPEAFHWVNFHSDADSDVVNWVSHALENQPWTVIREIGVQYDAALVITAERKSKNAMPATDNFSLWSVSLTTHAATPLVTGANLHFVDWLRFTAGRTPEMALFYDDCEHCQATTFFTAVHYDGTTHEWVARWLHAGQAAPVWSSNTLADGSWTQLYGLFPRTDGSVALATWSHFDDTTHKPQSDFVYLYSVDLKSGIESSTLLSGKAVEQTKQRLCRPENLLPGLGRGQDTPLCQRLLKPDAHPVTSPPSNNQGRATP
jgi:hypothetical protein